MRDILLARGFRYEQVIRTWLYLGDIVGMEGDTERYRELNRARADFYEGLCFTNVHTPASVNGAVYPASTGIGASDRDVMMGCIALATDREDIHLVPLENPQQTSAFDYGRTHGSHSPKFSRAMAVVAADTAAVLVSGTASIVNAETCHRGDVEAQTQQTLDNIEALIAAPNFARYGFDALGATLADMALVRVYIKRKEDYERTRAICEARLGELPAIYAVADVCRPNLLVEIEGVAFAHGG
jgi:enamine deaminase RidA (YjgF/YER057c/UK114 family)